MIIDEMVECKWNRMTLCIDFELTTWGKIKKPFYDFQLDNLHYYHWIKKIYTHNFWSITLICIHPKITLTMSLFASNAFWTFYVSRVACMLDIFDHYIDTRYTREHALSIISIFFWATMWPDKSILHKSWTNARN